MSIFTQPRQDVTPTDVLSQTLSAAMPGWGKGMDAHQKMMQESMKLGLSERLKMQTAQLKNKELAAKSGMDFINKYNESKYIKIEDTEKQKIKDRADKAIEEGTPMYQAYEASLGIHELETQLQDLENPPPLTHTQQAADSFKLGKGFSKLSDLFKSKRPEETPRGAYGPKAGTGEGGEGGLVGRLMKPENREEFMRNLKLLKTKEGRRDYGAAYGEGIPFVGQQIDKERAKGNLAPSKLDPGLKTLLKSGGQLTTLLAAKKAFGTNAAPGIAGTGVTALGMGSTFMGMNSLERERETGKPSTPKEAVIDFLVGFGFEAPELISSFKGVKGAKTIKAAETQLKGVKAAEGVRAKTELKLEPKALAEKITKPKELGKQIEKPRGVGKAELKAKEAARKTKAREISKQPLEEYFPEKKAVKHRPETIAKENVRVSSVESKISPLKADLEAIPKQRIALQNEREFASPARKTEIRSEIDSLKNRQESLKGRIKDLEFEKKYKKLPEREIDISGRAIKSVENLKESIIKGDAESLAKMSKALEKDKVLIDKTKALMKKGSLSPTEVLDEFTKIKKAYSDVYTDVIRNLEEDIKFTEDLTSTAAKKELKVSKKLKEVLEKRKARAETDLFRHQQKRSVQKLTKDPSGAFLRNDVSKLIKSTEGDLAFLKDNAFQIQKRGKPAAAIKTQKVAQRIKKTAETFTEDLKKAAEKGEGSLKEEVSKMGDKIDEASGLKEAKAAKAKAKTPEAKTAAQKQMDIAKETQKQLKSLVLRMGLRLGSAGGVLTTGVKMIKAQEIEQYKHLVKGGSKTASKLRQFQRIKGPEKMKKIRNASKRDIGVFSLIPRYLTKAFYATQD